MIAVGTNLAQVQLWDASSLRQIRTMPGHSARVGSLAWNDNIVSSGGRDALIINHDIRVPRRRIRTLQGHQQEVRNSKLMTSTCARCGLALLPRC